MNRDQLKDLFDPIQNAELECDGFSRVVVSMLVESGQRPVLMSGVVSFRGQVVRPHLWVEIDGLIIDYQARRWLGNHPLIPHGVFKDCETEAVYSGEPIQASVISAGLRALMLVSTSDLKAQASKRSTGALKRS